MSDTWKQWEGQTVDGAFPLRRYLGGSQRGAVFSTERRENGAAVPAAIKLLPSSAQKAELRLSRWRDAANLSHPNLIRLFETGRFELGGVPLVYVVMEMADENLGEVLAERTLTTDETRKMLEGLLGVLDRLHSKGFVLGHIKPSNILGAGDELKISSDRVCRAGEPLEDPGDPDEYDPPEYARGIIPVPEKTSPAADVWSLGVTLVESLTGNRPAAPVAGQSSVPPENLPPPFAQIASRCLRPVPQDRWKVAQIADCLAGRTPERAPVRTPTRAATPTRPRAAAPGFASKRLGFAPLAAIALAVAVLAIASFLWMRHPTPPQSAQSQTPESQASQSQPLQPSPTPDVSNPTVGETSQALPSAPNATTQPGLNAALGLSPENPDTKSPAPTAPALDPTKANRARPLRDAVESAVVPGEVTRQVMPQISHASLDTIQGTVRVSITVNVDPSGKVTDAQFESQGPSKYFSKMAMQAAHNWKFKPPEAAGRPVMSTWDLQFAFSQDGAKAVPTQTSP